MPLLAALMHVSRGSLPVSLLPKQKKTNCETVKLLHNTSLWVTRFNTLLSQCCAPRLHFCVAEVHVFGASMLSCPDRALQLQLFQNAKEITFQRVIIEHSGGFIRTNMSTGHYDLLTTGTFADGTRQSLSGRASLPEGATALRWQA
eukprot:2609280-Amphidinium_carterae.1